MVEVDLKEIYLLVCLIIGSYYDVRYMSIPKCYFYLCGIFTTLLIIFDRSNTLMDIIIGVIFGLILLILAKFTKESIGYADGLITLFIGLLFGGTVSIVIFMLASFLTGIFGIIVSIFKKTSLKMRLPLFPGILISYSIWMIIRGCGI